MEKNETKTNIFKHTHFNDNLYREKMDGILKMKKNTP